MPYYTLSISGAATRAWGYLSGVLGRGVLYGRGGAKPGPNRGILVPDLDPYPTPASGHQ